MNDHWVISALTEYAPFQKCPAFRRSNHHDQIVLHLHSTDRVTDRVLHIGISDSMAASRLSDSHLDDLSCLTLDASGSVCPSIRTGSGRPSPYTGPAAV
jgi:hypothetical protein